MYVYMCMVTKCEALSGTLAERLLCCLEASLTLPLLSLILTKMPSIYYLYFERDFKRQDLRVLQAVKRTLDIKSASAHMVDNDCFTDSLHQHFSYLQIICG